LLRTLGSGSHKIDNEEEVGEVDVFGNHSCSDLFNGIQPADISDGEMVKAKGRPKFTRLKASYEPKRSRSNEEAQLPEPQTKRPAQEVKMDPLTALKNFEPQVKTSQKKI